ncbi:MAG: 50S ribosomal protein L29 [Actinobacteria bacterium]|nr:50S ribosomal protein L29 [Actinomycetota bacterium]MBL7123772.1 50S ribosomal protein L29 [Actinomycetota bacterium]
MKTNEIREKTKEELEMKLAEVKKNLFSLKFKKSTGQLENSMAIKKSKKDIARISTLIREKELGINKKASKQKAGRK